MAAPSARNEAASAARLEDGVLTLQVHVQPGARSAGWAGRHGAALKLRLTAPAVDGKANAACIAFLAEAAAVPRRSVEITQGRQSRDKVVCIRGVSPARFEWLQTQWCL